MKTAVEWLYNKLSTCTSDEMVGNINNWFEQAKDMEKEQLKQLMWDRTHVNETLINKGLLVDNLFDNYWNENFKSE